MTADEKYKVAGKKVAGLVVRDHIPNITSIGAALENYDVLIGVRVVTFADFPAKGPLKFYSVSEQRRTERLADQIAASGEINPLIVVEDNEGPYVLEGAHRFDALRILKVEAFPALVVLDRGRKA